MFRAASALRTPQAILTLAGLLGFGSLSAAPLPEPPLAFRPALSDSAVSDPAPSHPIADRLYVADTTEAFSGGPAYKSPGAALGLSLLGTAVPILAMLEISKGASGAPTAAWLLGGLIVGPSVGQFYANSHGTAVFGMAVRVTGIAIAISGLSDAFHTCDEEETNCHESTGATKMTIGMLTLMGGTLYSLVDSPLSAIRLNEKQRRRPGFGWSPTLAPGSDGAWKTGAVAWMRF